jgi:osmotically-inducible protein OsmY
VAGERSADDIQRDIERARASLATSVDELAYRANPKRVTENVKRTLVERARTPQGQAVIGGVVLLIGFVVVRRIRKR